jgi:hypothetical protein
LCAAAALSTVILVTSTPMAYGSLVAIAVEK